MPFDTSDRTTACFSVQAVTDPSAMPRILELFAKRGLVPTRWVSTDAGDRLTIDIQMDGLEREVAAYIARCIRQIAGVEAVLTAEKAARAALSA